MVPGSDPGPSGKVPGEPLYLWCWLPCLPVCDLMQCGETECPTKAPRSPQVQAHPQVSARGAGSVAEVEAGHLAALGRRPGKVGRWAYLPEVWLRLRPSLVTLGSGPSGCA